MTSGSEDNNECSMCKTCYRVLTVCVTYTIVDQNPAFTNFNPTQEFPDFDDAKSIAVTKNGIAVLSMDI